MSQCASKRIRHIVVAFILALCMTMGLSACNGGNSFHSPESYADLPDHYVQGADYPMSFYGGAGGPYITPAESGYYFLADHYLYYLDEETLKATPLCNRPDCTHDEDCSAYFGYDIHRFIQYYEGKLYVQAMLEDTNKTGISQEYGLYEVDPESYRRRLVCKLAFVDGSCTYYLHRGYLYMYQYNSELQNQRLYRVALDELTEEPKGELIYEGKTPLAWIPYMYGNHYIMLNTKEDGDRLKGYLLDYNVKDGSTFEVKDPSEAKVSLLFTSGAVDHSLIFYPSDLEDKSGTQIDFYRYDYDKHTVEEFGSFPDKGDGLRSFITYDGANFLEVRLGTTENKTVREKQTISLLDENRNQIKSAEIGNYANGGGFCVGDEKFSFFFDDRSLHSYSTLYVVDKRDGAFEITTPKLLTTKPEEESIE